MRSPSEVYSGLSEMYSTLESMSIGENGKSVEIAEQIDNIEGYQTVSHEDLAAFYEMEHMDFSASYFGLNEMIGENLPVTQGERHVYGFIVSEDRGLEQITEDKTYAAGIGDGEIEVRDEELWENEEFQEIISEWSDWREDQKVLGVFDAKDLKVHQNF